MVGILTGTSVNPRLLQFSLLEAGFQLQFVVFSTLKSTASITRRMNINLFLRFRLTFDVHPKLFRHGLDSGEAGQAAPPKAAVWLGWK